MSMFFERFGEVFRVLSETSAGYYVISCEEPRAIIFVSKEASADFTRVKAPDSFIAVSGQATISESTQKKLDIIQELIDDNQCILDKTHLMKKAMEVAQRRHITKKRVLRLFYTYLGKGGLSIVRKRGALSERDQVFDKAIRKYYFSAKKMSLKDSYHLMLAEYYSDANGELVKNYPTLKSYEHFFYRRGYNKLAQREIAREGLSSYYRGSRPLYGAQNEWQKRCGVFQMDATIADVYIVDELHQDAEPVRPNIYLAVDTATRIIAGVYIGMEQGETAVLACLTNAAADKRILCKKYDIAIEAKAWPNMGLPKRILIDRGTEFFGERINELCVRYGLEVERLPPFRPDQKGCVEKAFDMIQAKYKPLLRGHGVVEPDAQERWAVDYRSQAVLTLHEFASIVIRCVVSLNSSRVLDNLLPKQSMCEPTPSGLWAWYVEHGKSDMLQVSQEELYRIALPREKGTITRAGLIFRKLRYINLNQKQEFYISGKYGNRKVVVAYNPNSTKRVYWVKDGEYIPFEIAPANYQYREMSFAEYEVLREEMAQMARKQREQETRDAVEVNQYIQQFLKEKRKKKL